MPADRTSITCACGCGRTGPHHGRGLIGTCHRRESRAGRLDQWPTYVLTAAQAADLGVPLIAARRYSTAERIADYIDLREFGLTQREAADRMGVAYRSTTRWHRTLRAARAPYPWLYDIAPHNLARATHHHQEMSTAA